MSLFDNIPEGTDIIEVRKKVNKMLSEARKKAKPPKCILCGKEQSRRGCCLLCIKVSSAIVCR